MWSGSVVCLAVGYRVEVPFHLDVVVEPDLAQAPLGQHVGLRRQRLQPGLVHLLEQLTPGAADVAEHPLVVQPHEQLGDGGVHLGQAVEPSVAQTPEQPALHDPNAGFDLRLVARLARTRRQDGGVVVFGQLRVGAVHLRIVEAGLDHRDLGVVRHDQLRRAAEVVEGLHVALGPVDQLLAPAGVGERQAGSAHHRHEDVGRAGASARLVHDHRHGVAGVVHKELLAAQVGLAHGHRQPGFPAAVELAEAAVAVALGVGLDVLVPEDLQRDVLALQLAVHRRPVGLRPATMALPPSSLPIEARLELGVGQLQR